jgi:hypothetical protein
VELHQVWHVLVLAVTILAAAGGVILLLAPLVFDPVPEGLHRARPYVLGLILGAGILLAVEWLGVHGGN